MSTRHKSLIAVIVLPLVVSLSFLAANVASARTTHPEHSRTAIATATITIHSFAFTVPKSVLHGALVKVVNKDAVAHTVTSNRAGKFNVSVPAHSSKSFRAPSTPMKYGFFCAIHPSMKGVLKVR
jgi:plastocyanin